MNLKSLKRLFSYLKGSTGIVVLSVIIGLLFGGATVAIPYFAGRAIDSLGDTDTLIKCLFIITGLIVVAALLQFILIRMNNRVAFTIGQNLRNATYSKMHRVKMSYIDRTSAGKLQSLIISDVETVSDGMLLFLNQFASGIATILITLVVMFYINWKISLIVVIFTPVSIAVSTAIAKGAYKSFSKQAEIRSKQTSFVAESVNNFRECKLYNVTDKRTAGFDEINGEYRKTSTKATFLSSISNPSSRFVNALIYAGVVLTGCLSGIGGAITVGALTSLLAYANQFMKPFNDLSAVYTELSDSFACLARVFEYLDSPEIPEEKARDDLPSKDVQFDIEFKNVSFSYVEGRPVLKDISFKVGKGESFAIAGPTGCGKTTLINLLMRYYEPDSGDILINGKSIKDIPRSELRHYIGFVSQDTWLSDDTVMENIRFSGSHISEEQAIEASKKAGCDSFIRKLPKRYNEMLDNERDDISEGQKQLLTIARAMASDPSILILDEATSSVDVVTEDRIQKAVKKLLNGRTSIIIAHRLSQITSCDKIVVIDGGKVSEIGSHAELIANGGFYSKLYASYISG
ncbi:ATP-binding cassette subfamily B protein [Ruminococcaceae bacterium R-25]|nr:ATP-binding cassette subfamily B protein [Ruminococcaceae bacterium R-25]SUQ11176.1 ATP-binding cassette, subfamily B [Oscillospiraceae bacterium]